MRASLSKARHNILRMNINVPERRALSRKDFAAMDDKTLLTAYRTKWYRRYAAEELKRRGIDAARILQRELKDGELKDRHVDGNAQC